MESSEELLNEWKVRLGLHDWRIKLNPKCTSAEMGDEEDCGCTTFEESTKTARIDILDPQYYGERIVPFDFEETLVHELLHLKLSIVSIGVPDAQERYMHQIIDDLARAFVDAKRSERSRLWTT